jgi:hypothetical protein
VSRHWNSDDELARCIAAEELARAQRRWPEGATVGLVLVAASCLALGVALYQFAGPRDVVEDNVARL